MIENYSIELEQRVLETLMHFGVHNNALIQKSMLVLQPQCFYNAYNVHLFGMIHDCFKKQLPFSFVDILVLIPKDNPALHDALAWIMDNYRNFHTGESGFEYDVERLLLFLRLRQQMKISTQMIEDVKNCPNPEDAQNILISSLHEISSISFKKSKHGISNAEIAEMFYDDKLDSDLIHITTCNQLNNALNGGIMSKSLIAVAAGAGVGKTSFSIFLLESIARNQPDNQTLFFSLEMEAKHIWMRHVGICGKNQFEKLNKTERLNAVAKAIEIPMQIYDSAICRAVSDIDFIITTSQLRAMDKKISVIVVDYLGLVECQGNFESNALKQTEIASRLAKLAIELDCIVIALTQINRSPSARATDDRCPYPSDASGSSGSYFSSTLWLGVDRPELYQNDAAYRNQFVIKCRKNRFGGAFELILAFNNGTFSEVPPNFFRKPILSNKNIDKDLFPAHSKGFYPA